MFGYRLVRESDWDALQAELRGARAASDALHAEARALSSERASAKTMYEAVIARVNVLELENAQFRNKLTGLPSVAPQLSKGNPLEGSGIGAGVDLFEDVGDDKARDLRDKGLLHAGDDLPDPPAASVLSAGLAGA